MKLNRYLLITASITPLLIVLIIASLNISKTSRIRILIWQSPSATLGTHMAIGALTGSFIAFTSLYTITKTRFKARRRIFISPKEFNDPLDQHEEPSVQNQITSEDLPDIQSGYFERDIRDPSPTVSVPYRILKKRSQNIPINNSELQKEFQGVHYDDYDYQDEEYDFSAKEYNESTFPDFEESSIPDNSEGFIDRSSQSEDDWSVAINENW